MPWSSQHLVARSPWRYRGGWRSVPFGRKLIRKGGFHTGLWNTPTSTLTRYLIESKWEERRGIAGRGEERTGTWCLNISCGPLRQERAREKRRVEGGQGRGVDKNKTRRILDETEFWEVVGQGWDLCPVPSINGWYLIVVIEGFKEVFIMVWGVIGGGNSSLTCNARSDGN